MPLVVPDMVRIRVKGRQAGNRVEQVLDFKVTPNEAVPTPEVTRTNVIEDELLPDFLGGWENHVLPLLATAYTFDGIEAMDLDVPDGQIWELSSGETGQNPGDPLPSNVCASIRKVSNRVRGARAGRLFLGGLVDAAATANTLATTTQGEIQSGFNALWGAVEETGNLSDHWIQWCVIHTRDGEPWGVSPVTSFAVDAALTHQDRRIRVR